MDAKTTNTLRRYLAEMPGLPNESAKTHRFVELLAELFPGSSAVTEFVGGFENLIHIDTTSGTRRRRVDTYYGNAVIEFEKSLKATEEKAKEQLREHATGVWAREPAPRFRWQGVSRCCRRFRSAGKELDEIVTELLAANANRCMPPLEDRRDIPFFPLTSASNPSPSPETLPVGFGATSPALSSG